MKDQWGCTLHTDVFKDLAKQSKQIISESCNNLETRWLSLHFEQPNHSGDSQPLIYYFYEIYIFYLREISVGWIKYLMPDWPQYPLMLQKLFWKCRRDLIPSFNSLVQLGKNYIKSFSEVQREVKERFFSVFHRLESWSTCCMHPFSPPPRLFIPLFLASVFASLTSWQVICCWVTPDIWSRNGLNLTFWFLFPSSEHFPSMNKFFFKI